MNPTATKIELGVVMPVFNEEACISGVVDDWNTTLADLDIDYRIYVYNDGSTDNTASVLSRFAEDEHIHVEHQTNKGHGPTVLAGYQFVADIAQWVFQCDSDDEMRPGHFVALWEKRNEFDALFGFRTQRRQNPARWLISRGSQSLIGVLFGSKVRDVNVPYRLIRSSLLRRVLPHVPADSFVPNILIAGWIAQAADVKVHNEPIPHEQRKTGIVSLGGWRLWKAACLSFWQTVRYRQTLAAAADQKADLPQKVPSHPPQSR